MTHFEALDIARKLRNDCELSWPSVSRVMSEMHGINYSPTQWKRMLRLSGEVRLDPRGCPFAKQVAA